MMIKINICRNKEGCISEFTVSGHAGYAEEGSDIVCAAVSVLVINTINAIEALTNTVFQCKTDEAEGGFLQVSIPNIHEQADHDACVLLKSLVMGLNDVEKEYSSYVIINDTLNEGGV